MTHLSKEILNGSADEEVLPRMAMKDGQGRPLVPIPDPARLKCGSILDSINLTAIDRDTCIVDRARQALLLVQMESCGLCVFCREGTIQMIEILTDISEGRAEDQDLDLLLELGEIMRLGASCFLGRLAPDAVLFTIRHFRPEYETHIKGKRCSAGICNLIG